MPIRLIALDLDDTLLDSAHGVPPENRAAVGRALARGIAVVLASARPPRNMRRYHEALALATPAVACNGALLYDLAGRRAVRHLAIPLEAARAAVAHLRTLTPPLNLSLECEDTWHVDCYDPGLQQAVKEYGVAPPHGVGTVDAVLADGCIQVTKILFNAWDMDEVEMARLGRLLGPGVVAVRTSERLVEVMAAGVSKADGVAWVARSLGVLPAECLALGDSDNDVPLLAWAGIGVAMGNAPERVQRAADAVTGTQDEAGVAAAIERYAL